MANNVFYHPHVALNVTAKRHRVRTADVPDTTIMFAPIVASKGKDGLTKVHSLAEFVNEFGAMDSDFYKLNGLMAYNIYNWLSNGGTLLVSKLKGKLAKVSVYAPGDCDIVEDTYEIDKSRLVFVKNTTTNKYEFIPDAFGIIKAPNGTDVTSNVQFTASDNVWTISYTPTGADSATELVTFSINETTDLKQVSAKYSGSYYNHITVKVTPEEKDDPQDIKRTTIVITKGKEVLESYKGILISKIKSILSGSEYIDTAASLDALSVLTETTYELSGGTDAATIYYDENYEDTDSATLSTLKGLKDFWTWTPNSTKPNCSDLELKLEYPIDIIFDAGYPKGIKQLMINFIRDNNGVGTPVGSVGHRTDIFGIFDAYALTSSVPEKVIKGGRDETISIEDITMASISSTNIAVYDPYFTTDDVIFTNETIPVFSSYALAKLIAYNDLTYGPQLPVAGLRRAIIDDVLSINENPNSDRKEQFFLDRVNYAEKTSREYAFMSQRTADGSTQDNYTALSFINNSRCLLKMEKDIEIMARQYLHEYNDAVTISNLSKLLNNYVSGWVSNRTLSLGYVDVSESDLSENELVITLNVKFTSTIEVITVNINID